MNGKPTLLPKRTTRDEEQQGSSASERARSFIFRPFNGRKVTSTSSLAFGSCARSLARLRDEMQSKKLVLPTGANLYLLSCLGSIGLGNSRLLLSLGDFGKYTVLNCPMYFVIICQNILEHVWFHPCNSYKWNNQTRADVFGLTCKLSLSRIDPIEIEDVSDTKKTFAPNGHLGAKDENEIEKSTKASAIH